LNNEAARNLGFIYITGHGVSRSLMKRIFAISAELFQLEDAEKSRYSIGPENRGWSRMGSEKLDPATQKNADYKEAFNLAPGSDQALPAYLEQQRVHLLAFEDKCQDLLLQLCRLLALGLGLPRDYFASKHNRHAASGTIMRLLYYPASSATTMTSGEVRAGAHTDYGSLTLLFQNPGQSGLEVRNPVTGQFDAVPAPTSDSEDAELPILVNVADQLTLWTAGQLKSAVHRVTSSYQGDRYSIAYFCHPDDDTSLAPIAGLQGNHLVKMDGAVGLTAGEHLRQRLAATYSY
jgi:isopenicillin N synthase-like dioxygenase